MDDELSLMYQSRGYEGSHDGLVEWLTRYDEEDMFGHSPFVSETEDFQHDYNAGTPSRAFSELFPGHSWSSYLEKRYEDDFARMRGLIYCAHFDVDFRFLVDAWIEELSETHDNPLEVMLTASELARNMERAPSIYSVPEEIAEAFHELWMDQVKSNDYGVRYHAWLRWGLAPRHFAECFEDFVLAVDWFSDQTGMSVVGLGQHPGFRQLLYKYVPPGDALEADFPASERIALAG